MTVLIGFSFPDLIVLGADGRGTAVGDRDDVLDDFQKIYKTGFGFMAGAGRSDVIEAVTARFKNHAPASNQEASEIIRAEVAKLGLPDDHPALERTCWLATYTTNTANGPEARLALATRDDNYAFDCLQHNKVIILRPLGMSEAVGREFSKKAQSKFDERIRDAPPDRRVGLCALMISGIVKKMAELNDSVGPRWSVAYQDTSQRLRLSNVGDDVEAMEWHYDRQLRLEDRLRQAWGFDRKSA
jgi:hypothetical protein